MASRRTPEQLEHAAGLLKQLSDLAHNVAQTRRERDRLLARLFREQLATTGEIASATGLSPNRIRGIAAAAAPAEVDELEEPAPMVGAGIQKGPLRVEKHVHRIPVSYRKGPAE